MQYIARCYLLMGCLAANVCLAAEPDMPLVQMRRSFLQAEQYINQERSADYFALAENLKNYVLYPYLQYLWLKKHLDDNQAVSQFINDYPQNRFAGILRGKWLLQLGKNRQWPLFMQYYRPSDDADLQCYQAQAQYQSGQPAQAADNARRLWLSGKSQPASCDAVFAALKTSADFTPQFIRQRFQAALQLDNQALARQLLGMLPADMQAEAELWLKLHRQPQQIMQNSEWKQHPQAGELFAHTVGRWLETEPLPALQIWDAEKRNFSITAGSFADIEKRLALALAFKRDVQAYSRLSQLPDKDGSTREWRVRAALSQQNWPQVQTALEGLSEEEKAQDKWQYWQARTHFAIGNSGLAQSIYQQLAQNRSFYGYLAAGRLQQNLNLADHALPVATAEIDDLKQRMEFQTVAELLAIDRKPEARRQWWPAIAGLDLHGLTVAAKLAQQWQLPDIAIFTIAKANSWDDMDLRFPLRHTGQIDEIARQQQLNPALILGLIRQESAFDEQADSPAGAKGLMQVMPSTAKHLADSLHEDWRGEFSLFNPQLNLRYGSMYYKQLLQQFNGNHVLAAAAYNAGPNRVKRWLPESAALPGDIWLESIPYKETRSYVSSVLFYTLVYQQRLQKIELKPEHFVIDVQSS